MNPIAELKKKVNNLVVDALETSRAELNIPSGFIPEFTIEKPREKAYGDFACNAAMLLARAARKQPREIALILMSHMQTLDLPYMEKIETAGAGFINFYFTEDWLYDIPELAVRMKNKYGAAPDNGKKVQVEFVSANPTGNLHMGNARGGALGDSLASLLSWAGFDVKREFYINDAGNQIANLEKSLEARYLNMHGQNVPFPEDGYPGQDVIDTVNKINEEYKGGLLRLSAEDRGQILLKFALEDRINYIKDTLGRFKIKYDVWFSEKTLHETGKITEVINVLRQAGFVYQKDGTWWLQSTLFGDEKDEVLVRANGIPTYFAADIAYHNDKFKRGFDRVINIWGADHHGHVLRMKGAMQALGYDPDNLEIILMQLVRLYRGGELVRMSKRTGTTVSLDELLEEVGVDAARFTFVLRSPDSHLDFDLELAKQKNMDNPVYYVQYAHARICSVFRQAQAWGGGIPDWEGIDAGRLQEEAEKEILRKIAEFPEEIEMAAQSCAPHRIARYVLDLAGLFHSYYNHYRVLNDDADLQNARLLLLYIIKVTICNALQIIGVDAPEQM
ncbi:MAG: arginine--tRNA ligase [Syntrophomonadaceae bacterium]|nr:arginine--tRNA ligase [Syntrophomonadaceae bacterium]